MCGQIVYSDWSGVAAVEALRKGLEDLQEMCGHVLKTFKVGANILTKVATNYITTLHHHQDRSLMHILYHTQPAHPVLLRGCIEWSGLLTFKSMCIIPYRRAWMPMNSKWHESLDQPSKSIRQSPDIPAGKV